MTQSGKIGAVVYDLRASGVVRNLLRIAERARADGIDFEIWPLRAQGEFLGQAKDVAPVDPVLEASSSHQRDLDSFLHHSALAEALGNRSPSLLFSPGNQMHWHIAKALQMLPANARPRFVGRASNAVVSLGDANPIFRAIIKPQERFQFQAMHHVVAVSEELQGQLVNGIGFDTERVSCVPNGIDIDRYASGHGKQTENERPIILGIGRLSKQKDFNTLIDALAKLRITPKPVLRILGRGTDGWIASLKRYAENKGIADQLELLGHVDDVTAHLRQADLFVSSSRWEGASNVVLEALACGTPLVATKAPTGIAEVLRPLDEDILVPVGDASALAQAIERRLGQPRGSAALIARARDYDLSSMLADYSGLLAEQLSRAQRRCLDPYETQSARLQHS
ncbi:glycosyltransferase [Erythrobacter sp. MTPC3]|uniref:glycosyltransferase n=1 Tax=Erythrobacter sp. MTPC3 TaxID=3056564 RepID=UPI0036F41337